MAKKTNKTTETDEITKAILEDKDLTPDEEISGDPTEKTDEEIEKELISDYLIKTSRNKAIEALNSNIETIRQGYRQIWQSGINGLDDLLSGGFHAKRLYFLGAISSLGKTSLALQIADNVAESGRDVVIFSLEMDSDELLSKSISRETYLLSCGITEKEKSRLTTQEILNGEIGDPGDVKRALFDEALEKTRKINDNLFYYIGDNDVDVDTIGAVVELHRKARNQSPLVIVDYLQILRPTEDAISRRLDKRLITDDDVTKLKVLARDHNLPVIVISAFNRESYLEPVTMTSFRESSGIEYSSDVLIGLQYTNMDYKKRFITTDNGKKKKVPESKKDHEQRVRELFDRMDKSERRPIELKVLKSRVGVKGSVFLDFISPYSVYEETGTSNKPPRDFDFILPENDEDDNPFLSDYEDKSGNDRKSTKVNGEDVAIIGER